MNLVPSVKKSPPDQRKYLVQGQYIMRRMANYLIIIFYIYQSCLLIESRHVLWEMSATIQKSWKQDDPYTSKCFQKIQDWHRIILRQEEKYHLSIGAGPVIRLMLTCVKQIL